MNQYSKYKQSAMIGLERIPSQWKELRFKNICSLVRDSAHPGDRKIALENIESSTGRFISTNSDFGGEGVHFEKEDVLFGKLRPYLAKVYLAEDTGQAIGDFYVFRAKDNVLPDYLQKLAISVPFIGLVNSGTYGAKMPRASWNDISQLVVPLPPVYEQKAIISFLSLSSERIERAVKSKQRQIELLEEYKQAIIAQAVTRGLNPDVKMKFMDTPLQCEHPEHWKRVRNMSFMVEQSDSVGKNSNDFALLSLTTNGVILRDMESGKGKFPKDFESYSKVEPNEIIFCLFDIDETPRTVGLSRNYGMITGAYDIFKIKESLVLSEYVYYYYLAIDNIKALRPYYSGLRKVVKHNRFMQIGFPMPPMEEQIEIVDYVKAKSASIDNLKVTITQEISLLQEYKQRLISDVVTGQINVQNEIV